MPKQKAYIYLLLIVITLTGCHTYIMETVYPTLNDGKYDSEFPYKNCSEQLEIVSQSVKLVNVLVYYQNYVVDEKYNLTKKEINSQNFEAVTRKSGVFHKTSSGTSTIIHGTNGNVALITCAHIINFPDTVYTYKINDKGNVTNIVESIAIKIKQTNYINDFPEGGDVNIILVDELNDLAIIGKRFVQYKLNQFPVFNYPLGEAKKLEWGSFVYALGYPMNYKMITKGIVSSPNRDENGSFLIDAVFNRGFSGGIVLAIKDGVPNFELVGMVRSVPAEYEYVLKPEIPNEGYEFNPLLPYKGNIMIEQRINIKYGVTRVIPIETIIDFINKNSDKLLKYGYIFENFKK
jgi:hypothetical protein